MDERMKLMREIKERKQTHECPECGGPAYCAMEAGKSSNLCWCMTEPRKDNPDTNFSTCLCKSCLTK